MNHNKLFSFRYPILTALCCACLLTGTVQAREGYPPPTQKEKTSLSEGSYKRYEGTIAKLPVVVLLEENEGVVEGSYYYEKTGNSIAINGSPINGTDSVVLYEYDRSYFVQGTEAPPVWNVIINGKEVKGRWTDPNKNKSYEIALTESYPDGVQLFRMVNYYDSVIAFPKKGAESPKARTSYTLPLLVSKNISSEAWFTAQLKQLLDIHESQLSVGVQNKMDSFLKSYQDDLGTWDSTMNEEMLSPSWNYEQSVQFSIAYNAHQMITLSQNYYDYLGGAHGNYNTLFTNLDLQLQKTWKLSDVLHADSTTLQQLLETTFRKEYRIPAPKPLTELLFDSTLATTDNFYICEKGLKFLYNPYEIASYADGQITIFIPYTQLKNYLTEAFKKRMSLQ